MAIRCALLIFVTGIFIALWSGDKPDQFAVINRPAEKRNSHESSNGDVGAETSSTGSPTIESRLNAPLPQEITSGAYLVVDQFGRSETRVILARETTSRRQIRNHYSIEIGAARWHFIRLDSANLDRTAKARSTGAVVK